MYRQFRLKNSLNNYWELTNVQVKSFLNDPQGLGFQNTYQTTQYGNAVNVDSTNTSFPSVTGNVLFYGDTINDKYINYNQFVTFLSYQPLVLEYIVPGLTTYYLDVVVASLGKGEVGINGIMDCPINLQGLGMWKGNAIRITNGSGALTLTNSGHFPVGFEITIEGSLENPYFTLSQNSEIYGEAKFNDSAAFNSVYVNSNDGEHNVELQQGGSVLPNPLSYQDLSISNGSIYVTFVKLARGTSTLTIGMDSGSITSVEIRFAPQYRSV